ncbi:EthD family reductase [Segetibacter koreensis]|uniref:EthD family reductase n=1 Tax=Segetibacter koreensis TaxID=398037 RepID=UPI00039E6F76|nr:EthD family reductase [Segetibacter koreensis]
MAKMTVIYRNPKDKEIFEQHYFNVHIPLAKQLPELKKYEISKAPIISPTGHSDTYLVANLYFDSMEDIKKAFSSEVGQKCALDRKILAPNNDDIQIYLFDTIEV